MQTSMWKWPTSRQFFVVEAPFRTSPTSIHRNHTHHNTARSTKHQQYRTPPSQTTLMTTPGFLAETTQSHPHGPTQSAIPTVTRSPLLSSTPETRFNNTLRTSYVPSRSSPASQPSALPTAPLLCSIVRQRQPSGLTDPVPQA